MCLSIKTSHFRVHFFLAELNKCLSNSNRFENTHTTVFVYQRIQNAIKNAVLFINLVKMQPECLKFGHTVIFL